MSSVSLFKSHLAKLLDAVLSDRAIVHLGIDQPVGAGFAQGTPTATGSDGLAQRTYRIIHRLVKLKSLPGVVALAVLPISLRSASDQEKYRFANPRCCRVQRLLEKLCRYLQSARPQSFLHWGELCWREYRARGARMRSLPLGL